MTRRRRPTPRASKRAPKRVPITQTLLGLPVIGAALLLAVTALFSLGWGIEHDAPTLAYMGFLIGHFHVVPYREIFDVNLPGTYLFYTALDLAFGPHDFGWRCVDVALLAVVCGLTWKALKPFGWMPAVLGPTMFGLSYLRPVLSLQREYLMLPFFALAFLLATQRVGGPPWRRGLGIGLACGLAALIKPQAMLVLPICLAGLLAEPVDSAGALRHRVGIFAAGSLAAAAPIALVVLWMVAVGALSPYLDMARHYYPLYAHLSAIHETMSEAQRRHYLREGWVQLGGLRWWLVPAGLGAFMAFRAAGPGDARRRAVLVLVALTFVASLFPVLSGQFFSYHWIPLFYFVTATASLCLTSPTPRISGPLRVAAVAALALVALTYIRIAPGVQAQFAGLPYRRQMQGRVDFIADYLRETLRPGDTVQPLDWTGGALDAMWRARAPAATRYLADFYFYHHISSPYIQGLRRSFMADLRRARPRVVIEIETAKPWVRGKDTTREFPELHRLLDEQYVVDFVGPGFVLHLRRE